MPEHLVTARLSHADLSGADLARADLRSSNLEGALLEGAQLSGAHLTRARYSAQTVWPDGFDPTRCGAIGPGADLRNANLKKAFLRGADLRNAMLDGADLGEAIYDSATQKGSRCWRMHDSLKVRFNNLGLEVRLYNINQRIPELR